MKDSKRFNEKFKEYLIRWNEREKIVRYIRKDLYK